MRRLVNAAHRRWWLPGGVAAAGVPATSALYDGVREHGDLSAYDPMVTADVVAQREGVLTVLAQVCTALGSTLVVGSLTLALLAWTGWRRQWRTTFLVAATMAVAVSVTVALKHLAGRPRPPAALVLGPVDTGYAFPSGHTLNSTVFLGLVAAVALLQLRSRAARIGVVVGAVSLSLAVGLSRIYLGYHWLTDVLAGWSIALAVLAMAAIAWRASTEARWRRPGPGGGATCRDAAITPV